MSVLMLRPHAGRPWVDGASGRARYRPPPLSRANPAIFPAAVIDGEKDDEGGEDSDDENEGAADKQNTKLILAVPKNSHLFNNYQLHPPYQPYWNQTSPGPSLLIANATSPSGGGGVINSLLRRASASDKDSTPFPPRRRRRRVRRPARNMGDTSQPKHPRALDFDEFGSVDDDASSLRFPGENHLSTKENFEEDYFSILRHISEEVEKADSDLRRTIQYYGPDSQKVAIKLRRLAQLAELHLDGGASQLNGEGGDAAHRARLADVYAHSLRLGEAMGAIQVGGEEAREHARAASGLGFVLAGMNRPQEAERAFKVALRALEGADAEHGLEAMLAHASIFLVRTKDMARVAHPRYGVFVFRVCLRIILMGTVAVCVKLLAALIAWWWGTLQAYGRRIKRLLVGGAGRQRRGGIARR